MKRLEPVSLQQVKTIPLARRRSLVEARDFARTPRSGSTMKEFLDGLPLIQAGEEFRFLVKALAKSSAAGRMVLAGMGGHVVKCGLSPVIIELLRRGVFRAIAMNGAAAIHDFEIALAGRTSEDVDHTIDSGEFGFAEETGRLMNEAIVAGARDGVGMGQAIGSRILELGLARSKLSILAVACEMGLPATVHMAVGTDVIHQHPAASGSAIGEATLTDFRLLAAVVGQLEGGGVVLNLGSAVIFPEVFLKALSVARNLGHDARDFVTANLDFIQHYRPLQNVVRRPVSKGGRGIALTGHHEIMLPLVAAAVLEELDQAETGPEGQISGGEK